MSDDLKAQLEESQAAYQKLYAQHQEELAFIARWQKRVQAENVALRGALRDFAEHGTRFDMTPTRNWSQSREAAEAWWHEYIQRIDDSVSERARQALEAS